MTPSKFWIYLLLGLIVLAGGFSLWIAQQEIGTTPGHRETVSSENRRAEGDIIGENVTFTITELDRKKWELRVKRAVYDKDRSGARLEEVTGEFYNDEGQPVATFSAPKGKYTNEDKVVTLTHGVTVASIDEKGGKLKAPSMTWSSKSEQVMAEGGVELNMGGYATAKAEKCRFSLDFGSVSLMGSARSEISL